MKKCANFKSFRFKIETESVRNKSRRRKTLSLSLVGSLHSRFSKPKELLFPKKQHLYKNFPELVWWRTLKNISKFVANFFLRRLVPNFEKCKNASHHHGGQVSVSQRLKATSPLTRFLIKFTNHNLLWLPQEKQLGR